MSLPWFKRWTSTHREIQLGRISEGARYAWYASDEIARELGDDGALSHRGLAMTIDELSQEARIPKPRLIRYAEELLRIGLWIKRAQDGAIIVTRIQGWEPAAPVEMIQTPALPDALATTADEPPEEQQAAAKASAERTRRYRARKRAKENAGDGNVMPTCDADVTQTRDDVTSHGDAVCDASQNVTSDAGDASRESLEIRENVEQTRQNRDSRESSLYDDTQNASARMGKIGVTGQEKFGCDALGGASQGPCDSKEPHARDASKPSPGLAFNRRFVEIGLEVGAFDPAWGSMKDALVMKQSIEVAESILAAHPEEAETMARRFLVAWGQKKIYGKVCSVSEMLERIDWEVVTGKPRTEPEQKRAPLRPVPDAPKYCGGNPDIDAIPEPLDPATTDFRKVFAGMKKAAT